MSGKEWEFVSARDHIGRILDRGVRWHVTNLRWDFQAGDVAVFWYDRRPVGGGTGIACRIEAVHRLSWYHDEELIVFTLGEPLEARPPAEDVVSTTNPFGGDEDDGGD